MSYDPLIFGKDQTERIVGMEIKDGNAILYIQNPDGEVHSERRDHYYWMLSNKQHTEEWCKLRGNLHFQYGRLYTTKQHQYRDKSMYSGVSDVYALYNNKEAAMIKDGYTYFKGMKFEEVCVLAFDIETTGLEHNDDSKILLIANTLRKNGVITRKLFCYDDYPTQGAMIKAWCNWVFSENPSVITGHNIFGYDLPYMSYIAQRENVSIALGRNGTGLWFDKFESKFRKDQTQDLHYHKPHVFGREMVDTLFLAVKYDIAAKKYESYALKSIIATEGLEVKDRVFYDASQIRNNYTKSEEWVKIKQYAIHDGDDALALYDLMAPPFFYLTQSIPKPYQLIIESASGSQINAMMVRSYLQNAHSIPKADEAKDYEGAISFGHPGIYKNVFKIDVASLYPSIMLEFNVYDPAKDPNGHFLQLVKTFTEKRLEYKKRAKESKYYDDLQAAYKIFINSAYGFLGTQGLHFNSPSKAALVTETGRHILQTAIDWATQQCFKIVNADTDSISFCESNGDHLSEDVRKDLLRQVNALYPERIRFEDDGYYPKVIVVKAKNYILWDGKKINYKGSAIKATTLEPALKEFINRVIDSMLNDRADFSDLYHEYVKEIDNVTDIKRWVTRKTITSKTLTSERANETKVKDAIANSDYREGDRAYFYFKPDGALALAEKFDGVYDKDRLYEKLFKACERFETVLDTKQFFLNYKLKRNKGKLNEVLSGVCPQGELF